MKYSRDSMGGGAGRESEEFFNGRHRFLLSDDELEINRNKGIIIPSESSSLHVPSIPTSLIDYDMEEGEIIDDELDVAHDEIFKQGEDRSSTESGEVMVGEFCNRTSFTNLENSSESFDRTSHNENISRKDERSVQMKVGNVDDMEIIPIEDRDNYSMLEESFEGNDSRYGRVNGTLDTERVDTSKYSTRLPLGKIVEDYTTSSDKEIEKIRSKSTLLEISKCKHTNEKKNIGSDYESLVIRGRGEGRICKELAEKGESRDSNRYHEKVSKHYFVDMYRDDRVATESHKSDELMTMHNKGEVEVRESYKRDDEMNITGKVQDHNFKMIHKQEKGVENRMHYTNKRDIESGRTSDGYLRWEGGRDRRTDRERERERFYTEDERDRGSSEREKERSGDSVRRKDRSGEINRSIDQDYIRERGREIDSDTEDWGRDRDQCRGRDRGMDRVRDRDRYQDRDRDRGRGRDVDRDRDRECDRNRDRDRHRHMDDRYMDMDRCEDRDRERGRDMDRARGRDRDREGNISRDLNCKLENEVDKRRYQEHEEMIPESRKYRDKLYKKQRFDDFDLLGIEKYKYVSRNSWDDEVEYHKEKTKKSSISKKYYEKDKHTVDIKRKPHRDQIEQEDYQEKIAFQLAEWEEDDLTQIQEESRRRRHAILEKHKLQKLEQDTVPKKVEPIKRLEAKEEMEELPHGHMAKGNKYIDGVVNGADVYVTEPLFSVGKSPVHNGLSVSLRTSHASGLGEGTPKSEKSEKIYCDDIFGESPTGVRKLDKGDALQVERSLVHDNWDDTEGYYSYRFGEILDGRYEITAAHGKGVFSTVVRARDLKAGISDTEDVAIKIIRNNDTMYKAGLQELLILKKLVESDVENRRHCVRFISNFKYRNHLCLVFESLHMNLREVLKKFGRNIGLKLTAVRAYAKQLFIALKHLRNCGILHCDIKPDNMLVNDSKNVLKICDFGNAMFAGKNEITPYLVSRFYRAPEIILGLTYDHPLDIWSVGCCLYELYNGKVLFPGPSNNDMLRLHMELKGHFPKKMLRKGGFTHQHFDQDLNFHATEEDPVTKKIIKRLILNIKPKDISTIICNSPGEDPKLLSNFRDILDKIFTLDPEKRLTVSQALSHPFITGK